MVVVALRLVGVVAVPGGDPGLGPQDGHHDRLPAPLTLSKFEAGGIGAVGTIAAGRGRKPVIAQSVIDAIVSDTLHTMPDDESTQWSIRTMAERHGVGKDTVARIWKGRNLRPWRVDTFKLSIDPDFEAKLVDVVGLYLNPPERAVVFSFDEKTQCQALDRTQPSLPLKAGRGRTMTHDYKRNGTTDLFAALNVGTGEVLHETRKTHTGEDVLAFSNGSISRSHRTRRSMLCWTTCQRTSPNPCGSGWRNRRRSVGIFISRRRRRRG